VAAARTLTARPPPQRHPDRTSSRNPSVLPSRIAPALRRHQASSGVFEPIMTRTHATIRLDLTRTNLAEGSPRAIHPADGARDAQGHQARADKEGSAVRAVTKAQRAQVASIADEIAYRMGRRSRASADAAGSSSSSSTARQRSAATVGCASIRPGDIFGDIALVSDRPRTATVTATQSRARARDQGHGLPRDAAAHAGDCAEGDGGCRRASVARRNLVL
jgi:hypothetical protein